ncbi:hypothetical protein AKJ56_00245 [candidate division MSBL1 archaeon SCGC-AAA382N08]|uniref:Putative snRNP Sm-like protein n=1 Tax=candidate division MSBL1 archaeon SCGC-AAA382N08 TaxID=1698285 RepID=A0A133VQV0_9EURY|nr:hypothetical protein AKJ56_00245 [candidate division MSBL1 archaeon SCGC-AAA382N08]
MSSNRPFDALDNAIGSTVLVSLKWGGRIRGKLVSYDPHVNLFLQDAEEIREDEGTKRYGDMLIRGDSVVFISPAK